MFWVAQWKTEKPVLIGFSDGGRECEAIMQVNEEDTLYHVTTPSVSKAGKDNDFILLASRRKPCDSRCRIKWRVKTSLLLPLTSWVCSIFLRHALSSTPQGSIFDRPTFCQFAHPSAHWHLHSGGGALCWVHNQGRVWQSHQGWLNADKETCSKHFSFPCKIWPNRFGFRSPTTTRQHLASSPTSPQISLACLPASTMPSLLAATSWRPTRMIQQPRPCEINDFHCFLLKKYFACFQ